MFRPTLGEMIFIGLFVEGFFYGLYSAVFGMYLRYHWQTSKNDTNKTQNVVCFSLCLLYVFSIAVFVSDIVFLMFKLPRILMLEPLLRIYFIQTTSFGCSDFIAQFILIYRCWIVWGRNTRVVIIPSILASAFLGTWLSYNYSATISTDQLVTPGWGAFVLPTSIALSLTVNALVTGLIVYRILKVFREVKVAADDKVLGVTGGTKLRRIIFILIESGVALFSIQLARFVLTIVWTDAATKAFNVIVVIHQMLNGITPTIILVRTSMGLSFDDEKSMEEFAIESLRCASNHQNSVPETGSIRFIGQESNVDDIDEVQRRNDIDIIER